MVKPTMRCTVQGCPKAHLKTSAFCTAHKAAHYKSSWVKAWNAGKPKASPLRGTKKEEATDDRWEGVGYENP